MNRGAFERRFSRLDEAMRGLRHNRYDLLMRFATEEEFDRFRELLDRPAKIKGPLKEKAASEEMAEIVAFLEIWNKRLKTRLGQE